MSKNSEAAKIFREIAFILQILEEKESEPNIIFKIRSYNRAADEIQNLSSDIGDIYKKEKLKGLLKIPSIGKAIATKLEEYITTGKIRYYDELKEKLPVDISQFFGLEGIGPKTIKTLYDNLGIKNIPDLEKVALEGKIRNVPGFSEKKEELILKRIQFFRKGGGRRLIGEVYPLARRIEERLSGNSGVKQAVVVGSFRRMKETIGDIDYLVSVISEKDGDNIIDYFVNMPEVKEVSGRGPSKAFVKLNNGIDADLLVVPEESFGAAMQYFTGSKEHGIAMRKLAISKGLRLNEWGVFDKQNQRIAGESEEGVYQTLGLEWIPPEMRENRGEIELAKKENKGMEKEKEEEKSRLPQLIAYDDLRGDLQVHSNNTDGTMSIEEMALNARDKFGLSYIAISDHTKSLRLANGLDEKQLLNQANIIAELNDKIKVNNNNNNNNKHFRILSSAEVNILKDGSLDISNNVLDKLDIVGAAIHSHFSLPIELQTARLVNAAQNPSIDIIFHPTGRIINRREGYPVNISKLIEVAIESNTILEIDAYYDRLDLKDEFIRMTVENNVKLVIDSDAHHPLHYAFLIFGIGQARRGWAEKSDILNTLSSKELLDNLK
ncbi:MAG TPA: helix-hairpin-helix domain-containing protein [Nitrososphaeraceae archaeon]|nr:helix-hairpin-helix domain-containing protein [Nitrososphaeraceae archaeon]